MKQSCLETIKREYDQYYKSLRKVKNLEEKTSAYEKLSLVRNYLKLTQELEANNAVVSRYYADTDQGIIERIVNQVGIYSKGNIYVYCNTFENIDWDYCIPKASVTNGALDKYYKNLDLSDYYSTGNSVVIPVEKAEEFEKNNIVLYPPCGVNPREYFKDVRYLYFKTAMDEGLDQAIELLKDLKESNERGAKILKKFKQS